MDLKKKKILITCGPTWVAIDQMRIISNRSTGEIGHLIAKSLVRVDGTFTVLQGPIQTSLTLKSPNKVKKFTYYKELYDLMKTEIPKHDIIIHAAAVSDYKCKKVSTQKISSENKSLTLDLVPTQKIITKIKKWNPNCVLIGFKLESTMNKKLAIEKASAMIKKTKCDFVVANALKRSSYKGYLINNNAECVATVTSKKELVAALNAALKKY